VLQSRELAGGALRMRHCGGYVRVIRLRIVHGRPCS
jgi:hypothetical protein